MDTVHNPKKSKFSGCNSTEFGVFVRKICTPSPLHNWQHGNREEVAYELRPSIVAGCCGFLLYTCTCNCILVSMGAMKDKNNIFHGVCAILYVYSKALH